MVLCKPFRVTSIARPILICLFALFASRAVAAPTPFLRTNSCTFAANNGRCQNSAVIQLPTHAGAVLEFATAQCDVAAVDQPAFSFKLTLKGTGQNVDFYLAPSNTTVRPQSTRTSTIFTHPIKIHLKGFTQLDYEFEILNSGVVGTCSLTLQGE